MTDWHNFQTIDEKEAQMANVYFLNCIKNMKFLKKVELFMWINNHKTLYALVKIPVR